MKKAQKCKNNGQKNDKKNAKLKLRESTLQRSTEIRKNNKSPSPTGNKNNGKTETQEIFGGSGLIAGYWARNAART